MVNISLLGNITSGEYHFWGISHFWGIANSREYHTPGECHISGGYHTTVDLVGCGCSFLGNITIRGIFTFLWNWSAADVILTSFSTIIVNYDSDYCL